MTNHSQFNKGDKVTIEFKSMEVPCKVEDKRPAYGRWDYKLTVLDDGETVSDWVQEDQLETYNG